MKLEEAYINSDYGTDKYERSLLLEVKRKLMILLNEKPDYFQSTPLRIGIQDGRIMKTETCKSFGHIHDVTTFVDDRELLEMVKLGLITLFPEEDEEMVTLNKYSSPDPLEETYLENLLKKRLSIDITFEARWLKASFKELGLELKIDLYRKAVTTTCCTTEQFEQVIQSKCIDEIASILRVSEMTFRRAYPELVEEVKAIISNYLKP